ncbi:MAG: AmmeMemoRadiSam system protein A [Anaerolineaceae bacterium]|nr:AmmeMemoRadiSam system protein A [Anaerolineaceae bacterium]
MNPEKLSDQDQQILLQLARQSIELAAKGQLKIDLSLDDYSDPLKEAGASFVTLTESGDLRGCVGALEAYQPLVQDVCEHAVAAAMEDYRFRPVKLAEVPFLHIEISRLTHPEPLQYSTPEQLLMIIRPGIDGVIIRDGVRRATFLPQVWEKVPDKAQFLTHLCLKMGGPGNLWQCKPLQIFTYQVEEFQER